MEESDGQITCENVMRPNGCDVSCAVGEGDRVECREMEYDVEGKAWCVEECRLPDELGRASVGEVGAVEVGGM